MGRDGGKRDKNIANAAYVREQAAGSTREESRARAEAAGSDRARLCRGVPRWLGAGGGGSPPAAGGGADQRASVRRQRVLLEGEPGSRRSALPLSCDSTAFVAKTPAFAL